VGKVEHGQHDSAAEGDYQYIHVDGDSTNPDPADGYIYVWQGFEGHGLYCSDEGDFSGRPHPYEPSEESCDPTGL
jgi:hypothetical protein